jgi:pimeloyl-ACP methyl ester carboxylesterase
MGAEPIPPGGVTLENTGRFLADLAQSQTEKAILVGHSLGGVAISEAAERAPQLIAGLVYVAAIMPRNGDSALAMMGGKIPEGISLSRDGDFLTIDPQTARNRYYSGCEADEVADALARLAPQPIGLLQDQLAVTPERFGSVPRCYIECRDDNAVPPGFQRAQYEAMPCRPVFTIGAGHSPFLQDPDQLTAYLIEAAQAFGVSK